LGDVADSAKKERKPTSGKGANIPFTDTGKKKTGDRKVKPKGYKNLRGLGGIACRIIPKRKRRKRGREKDRSEGNLKTAPQDRSIKAEE